MDQTLKTHKRYPARHSGSTADISTQVALSPKEHERLDQEARQIMLKIINLLTVLDTKLGLGERGERYSDREWSGVMACRADLENRFDHIDSKMRRRKAA